MALVTLVVLLAIPVVEIWAAIAVGGLIGGFATVVLLICLSCVGVWTLKRQGIASWKAVVDDLNQGHSPGDKMLDGVIAMLGALLLVIPGFVTAAIGGLLLLPPVRALLRPLILVWMTKRAASAIGRSRMSGVFITNGVDQRGRAYQSTSTFGDVIDSEGWDVEPTSTNGHSLLPGDTRNPRDAH
ncbi:MAG TPA: FxsA family protein, partial [Microthrixaceae bacterium]|nr:FxsA family protein [Microthrixaceae bacterium]